jgi:hypothetical protein
MIMKNSLNHDFLGSTEIFENIQPSESVSVPFADIFGAQFGWYTEQQIDSPSSKPIAGTN